MPRGARPITLEELYPYYNGVFFSTVAIKGRLARLGPEGSKAMEEVSHFQKMITQYREAIQKTLEMKRRQS
jgi:hypothetical protein